MLEKKIVDPNFFGRKIFVWEDYPEYVYFPFEKEKKNQQKKGDLVSFLEKKKRTLPF